MTSEGSRGIFTSRPVPDGYEAAVLAWLREIGGVQIVGTLRGGVLMQDGFAGQYRVWTLTDNGGEVNVHAVNSDVLPVSIPFHAEIGERHPKAIAVACRIHQAMRGKPVTYDDDVFADFAVAERPGFIRRGENGAGTGDQPRWLTEGIRPDGTVEGHFVETHFLPIDAVYIAPGADGYVQIVLDGPGINYEARLPLTIADAMLRARSAPTTSGAPTTETP